jgi:hypothetical protein
LIVYVNVDTKVRIDSTGSTYSSPLEFHFQGLRQVVYHFLSVDPLLAPVHADVSDCAVWKSVVDVDFSGDPFAVPSDMATVDVSQAALGIITVLYDCDTTDFGDAVGDERSVNAYCGIMGYDGNGHKSYDYILSSKLWNSLDPTASQQPTPTSNYYDKSQTLALISGSTPKQISLSSAPTPTTTLATISATAVAGSWGWWEGYKYTWDKVSGVDYLPSRESKEDDW